MEKLNQLSEQVDFLIDMHEKSLEECNHGFEELIKFLESNSRKSEEAECGIDAVKEFLANKIDVMMEDFEQDIEGLKEHGEMIHKAISLPDGEQKDEIVKMLLEPLGELVETEKFKKQVLEDSEFSKKEFERMLSDIQSAVEEGGIEELEALFEAMDEERSEYEHGDEEDEDEEGCCSGCCSSCSLDDGCEEMADALKEMSEPYTISKDGEKVDTDKKK
ncbi:hypothetical protein ACFLY6_03290 [Candidatus Dependentiae bacterium]